VVDEELVETKLFMELFEWLCHCLFFPLDEEL